MSIDLPEFYFRTRDNGAFVFRVVVGDRQKRMDLDQIAVVNLNNGKVKPQGDHKLTDEENKAIADWMAERDAQLHARSLDDIERTIDHLNSVAHWAGSKASDEDLEVFTDRLLLTMHDLRQVLVRKKADRVMAAPRQEAAE